MADHHIATIQKNAREELRISLSEWKGYNLVSQRVWYRAEDGEMRPSKAGVVIRIERLSELIDGLLAAQAAAQARGLE
jgi:hypothetical protein